MATPRSITVVNAGLSGALDKKHSLRLPVLVRVTIRVCSISHAPERNARTTQSINSSVLGYGLSSSHELLFDSLTKVPLSFSPRPR